MRTPDDIVRMEVHYCVSYLVSTLAGSHECFQPVTGFRMMDGAIASNVKALKEITEQAFELASPIDDWQEAAEQEGWSGPHTDKFGATYFEHTDGQTWAAADWAELCQEFNIEPYQWEVFEHWIVSDWLADQLEAHGEKVARDFAGLTVWARTTTGQGIAMDSVIQAIAADLERPAAA